MYKVYKQTLGSGDYLLYLSGEHHCMSNDSMEFRSFMDKILEYVKDNKVEEAQWLASAMTFSKWNEGQISSDLPTYNTKLYCTF